MFGFLKKLFGTSAKRKRKALKPYLIAIAKVAEKLLLLDEGLRKASETFKEELCKELERDKGGWLPAKRREVGL